MLEVLGDEVPHEAGEVAGPVAFVEQLLELPASPLVDQLKVVVLLVDELSLELVDALLLRKDVGQDHRALSRTRLGAFVEGKPGHLYLAPLDRVQPICLGHFG